MSNKSNPKKYYVLWVEIDNGETKCFDDYTDYEKTNKYFNVYRGNQMIGSVSLKHFIDFTLETVYVE